MLLSVLILAVSLSIDALGAGISYGMRGVKIPFFPKIIICAFSIIYSGAAILAGKSLAGVFPPYASKIIGVSILTLMGLWIIFQSLLKKDKDTTRTEYKEGENTLLRIVVKSLGITVHVIRNPMHGDIDASGVIDISEAALLGLALSVDAIGVGVGCAFTGFHSMYVPLLIGFFQLLSLYCGTYIGIKFKELKLINEKVLAIAPGILLILLALLRII